MDGMTRSSEQKKYRHESNNRHESQTSGAAGKREIETGFFWEQSGGRYVRREGKDNLMVSRKALGFIFHMK